MKNYIKLKKEKKKELHRNMQSACDETSIFYIGHS